MIPALLLSFALAGVPADSAATTAQTDDPAVQLWISDDRRFLPGDRAKVQVRTREDGYLLVLHVDTDGHLRVLFPIDPRDDDFVRGGRKYEIRGRGGREAFTADSRTGQGTVYAAVSSDPFKFDGYVLGDHWDYQALAPQRLSAQPENDLNELLRRMSQDDFDYDILTYDVLDRVAYSDYYSSPYYATPYSSGYYGSGYYGGYGYRSGFSLGIFFGRPYRRFYYDPFFPAYDPFYDPFFYDPYYYPAYYTPYYYPRIYYPYYAYPFNYGYYNSPRYHYYGPNTYGPYTPYRFRGSNGTLAGYGGRGFAGSRLINTVYLPPRSRVIQPGTSSPARRLTTTEPRNVGQPAAPAARRDARRVESTPGMRDNSGHAVGGERRSPQGREVEARRSGDADGRRNANPRARQESWPQDVSPRRSENTSDVTARRADRLPIDATPRRNETPRDVTPRRADVERPNIERAPVSQDRQPQDRQPQGESRRSEEPSRQAPPPSVDRGGDRGNSGRSEAPSGQSDGGWSSGGRSGGSGGGGGGGFSSGGGRRH